MYDFCPNQVHRSAAYLCFFSPCLKVLSVSPDHVYNEEMKKTFTRLFLYLMIHVLLIRKVSGVTRCNWWPFFSHRCSRCFYRNHKLDSPYLCKNIPWIILLNEAAEWHVESHNSVEWMLMSLTMTSSCTIAGFCSI